jgi:hypothetical protein
MSIRYAIAGYCILALAAVSQARDYGQYENVPLEIKNWIESLRDAYGVHCCATADGYRPEEVQWDMAGNNYRVKVGSAWIVVPDSAVIKGPNRIGYAIVWLYGPQEYYESAVVRCFLPGPTS